jgi:hypothetical protein
MTIITFVAWYRQQPDETSSNYVDSQMLYASENFKCVGLVCTDAADQLKQIQNKSHPLYDSVVRCEYVILKDDDRALYATLTAAQRPIWLQVCKFTKGGQWLFHSAAVWDHSPSNSESVSAIRKCQRAFSADPSSNKRSYPYLNRGPTRMKTFIVQMDSNDKITTFLDLDNNNH